MAFEKYHVDKGKHLREMIENSIRHARQHYGLFSNEAEISVKSVDKPYPGEEFYIIYTNNKFEGLDNYCQPHPYHELPKLEIDWSSLPTYHGLPRNVSNGSLCRTQPMCCSFAIRRDGGGGLLDGIVANFRIDRMDGYTSDMFCRVSTAHMPSREDLPSNRDWWFVLQRLS